MCFLAFDIGSSYIKWTRMDTASDEIREVNLYSMADFTVQNQEQCEVDVSRVAAFIGSLIEQADQEEVVQGVYLSVQMHGLMLHPKDDVLSAKFTTWQDIRSLKPMKSGISALEYAADKLPEAILQRTGTWLNAGLSVVQLISMKDKGLYKPHSRLSLLGDAVTERLVGHPVPMHVTNACSTGLYDLVENDWSQDILALLDIKDLVLPSVMHTVEPVGNYRMNGKDIPIYCAVGDLQASALGANAAKDELIINVSTGSQLICIDDQHRFGNHETRAYFNQKYLRTITRIPAGRSLNLLIEYYQDIGKRLFGCDRTENQIWEKITHSMKDVTDAKNMKTDLHFYDTNQNGCFGSVTGISAANLRFDVMMYSAFQGMADYYYELYKQLGCEAEIKGICMIGGISKRTPMLADMIKERFNLPVRMVEIEQDTLTGLLCLARWNMSANAAG